jgi:hypothetical protein
MSRRKTGKASTGHQLWTAKQSPSPWRPQIKAQVPFPPERNVDDERDTKWLDPNKGVRVTKVNKQAH